MPDRCPSVRIIVVPNGQYYPAESEHERLQCERTLPHKGHKHRAVSANLDVVHWDGLIE